MPVNLQTTPDTSHLPQQIQDQNAAAEAAQQQIAQNPATPPEQKQATPPQVTPETPPVQAPVVPQTQNPPPGNVVPIQGQQELNSLRQLVQTQQNQMQQMQQQMQQMQAQAQQAQAPKLEDEYAVAFNNNVNLNDDQTESFGRDNIKIVTQIVEQKVQEAIQPLLVKLAQQVNDTKVTQHQDKRSIHEQQILSAVPNAEYLYSGADSDFIAWLNSETIPYSGGKTKRDILLQADNQMQTSTVIQILQEYNAYVQAKQVPQQQQQAQQQAELQQQVVPESTGITQSVTPNQGTYPMSRYNKAAMEFTKGNLPYGEFQKIQQEFDNAVASNRVDFST